jgi:rhodanese-related sulfurtransferase
VQKRAKGLGEEIRDLMWKEAKDGNDGGVLRGAIVILLAGLVIGLLFNGLLRASNGERGLAWIRQEVKLNTLEEVLADRAAGGEEGSDSLKAMMVRSAEGPGTEGGEEPIDRSSESLPPPPPVDEEPRASEAPSPDAEEPTPSDSPPAEESPVSEEVPVIPESGEPLLAQHGTIKALYAGNAAVFIDARSVEEFATGHIPGALNIPFDVVYEDPTLLQQLEAGEKPIVCYCDGSECELAENLAFALIDAGYRRVLVYEGGTDAWTGAGESLATGTGDGE